MRYVTVTVYEYLELEGIERDEAKRTLIRDWDSNIRNMTDDEIAEYCTEHEIEFTETGLEW